MPQMSRSQAPSQSSSSAPVVVKQEVERKWLVKELPDLTSVTGREISQGYIAVTDDGTEVRLRQKGEQFFQTIKTDGGLVRGEFEIELTRDQYDALWATTAGRRLEKTRYEIAYNGHTIELDLYKEGLTGLIVAEVEFPSPQDAALFIPPSWFGREVTEDKRYKNKNLAIKGLPAVEA